MVFPPAGSCIYFFLFIIIKKKTQADKQTNKQKMQLIKIPIVCLFVFLERFYMDN